MKNVLRIEPTCIMQNSTRFRAPGGALTAAALPAQLPSAAPPARPERTCYNSYAFAHTAANDNAQLADVGFSRSTVVTTTCCKAPVDVAEPGMLREGHLWSNQAA